MYGVSFINRGLDKRGTWDCGNSCLLGGVKDHLYKLIIMFLRIILYFTHKWALSCKNLFTIYKGRPLILCVATLFVY